MHNRNMGTQLEILGLHDRFSKNTNHKRNLIDDDESEPQMVHSRPFIYKYSSTVGLNTSSASTITMSIQSLFVFVSNTVAARIHCMDPAMT